MKDETHHGLCALHQAGEKMCWLIRRQGFFWPLVRKECIAIVKGCETCQRHVFLPVVPTSELHSVTKHWPFLGWAMNSIGEINPSGKGGYYYILVAINYFTKWVETIRFCCSSPSQKWSPGEPPHCVLHIILYRR